MIYPVVVMPITNDAGRNIGGENALEFMAQGTGGRYFCPPSGAELDKAFADIITELRTQYLLAFYPQNVPLDQGPFSQARGAPRAARICRYPRATAIMGKRRAPRHARTPASP